jgi:GNAT superfamily N-acetyltransferase
MNSEITALHQDAFESGPVTDLETDWKSQLHRNSLGWVTARDRDQLIGFVNVIWDGQLHAWIQDVMVDTASRNRGIGSQLIATARDATRDVGCDWLHVDFEEGLSKFYFDACGFVPTMAGLLRLRD